MPYKEAVRIVGSMDVEWSENPTREDVQADVDVEIDVVSMLPENPEQELQRFVQTIELPVVVSIWMYRVRAEGVHNCSVRNRGESHPLGDAQHHRDVPRK